MRRLIDPYGSFVGNTNALEQAITLKLAVGCAMIALGFVVPARFIVVPSILPMISFPRLEAAMSPWDKQMRHGKASNWRASIWVFASLAALATIGWVDWTTHTLPNRLGFTAPLIYATPGFREIWVAVFLAAFFRAGKVLARARLLSRALAEGGSLA